MTVKSIPSFLSTALPYVNAPPHLGHALEIVQADAIARAGGDSGGSQRVIRTLHGRGSLFVAAVRVWEADALPAAGPPEPRSPQAGAFSCDRHSHA